MLSLHVTSFSLARGLYDRIIIIMIWQHLGGLSCCPGNHGGAAESPGFEPGLLPPGAHYRSQRTVKTIVWMALVALEEED